ncbi:hypothetical protein QBC34DRAFT_384933 [Podospora aff. communis PSN243]|uniref:Rhodopsin domain-containing protein n=1 Tax=Podospora aff. communis PSN243 TaxID=3040156 RepID=A0AAV9G8N2_9PEZI|nr:hypothetical protein QBC34DRAFT_384933 [Podospora aff. communis PSN243]
MSNSGAWGPTPPGVDLTEDQNMDIISSVVAIMVVGLSSVVLRMITRLMKTGPGLAADDYVILFAAAMGIGTAVCCLISVQWGGGKHLWVVTHDEFTKLYQTTYAFVIIYITCISATKISILLFYRRIFGTGIVWAVVLVLTCAHWAEVTITWLVGCRPIDYYWRQYTDPTATGSCIDAPLFYFCNGIIGLVIDVAILLVPTPTIWKLNLPTTKKIFVGGILLLGGFVCVASAVRIVMMDQLVKSPDFTWAMSKVFIWSCCEPFVGIVCACLPTYAPLVRSLWRRTGSSYAGMPDDDRYISDKSKSGHLTSKLMMSSNGKKSTVTRERDSEAFRGDDEIELTVDISSSASSGGGRRDRGGKEPPSSSSSATGKTLAAGEREQAVFYHGEIMVRKDFSWESSS